MFSSIGLTLSGLIFTSVIANVYLEKKKYNNLENNIYRFLIIQTLFLLVLELCCVYTMSIRFEIPVINEILCRLYILGDVIWIAALIAYVKTLISGNKYENIFDLLKDKWMFGIINAGAILYIISCFLDIKYTSGINNELYVIGGKCVYVLYIAFIIVGFYMIKILAKDLDKDNLIKKLPIFMFMICFAVVGVIQLLYADLNDLTFLFAFYIVAMYFTIESQDIKLVSELEDAKKKAEDADKAKTDFLSKMSHEIRTPMNVILGFSETLMGEKELTEANTKKDVKNIYNAGKTLLEIINNILIFSRIESGRERVEESEYAISDIVGELDSYVRSKIEQSNVTFNINVDNNIPSTYIGDKLKVYRVLLNLINNSVKYTTEGEITLNISCENLANNVADLKFQVKDTGFGMKKETLENLFKEFSTLDTKDLNISGTGLGLVLVKKLLNMLDGNITFDSEYGIGTTFEVSLKQRVVGSKKLKDVKTEYKSKRIDNNYLDCSKYKILVVDDNKLNRKVLERLLRPYKANIELLESGIECIDKIKTGSKYDLILLDHMMPELDGIETIRVLRKTNMKNLPPIVAMTANVVTEIRDEYLKEGFSDYLAKPVDIKELDKLLNKYFNKKVGGNNNDR